MTNAQRFIDAFNATDRSLHARFGLKPSMPFTDAVRRAAAINSVVRRFEDDLIDFGRLRNAIVHRSNSSMTIAEPHDDITKRFERIAALLSEPPLASSIAHPAETAKARADLLATIKRMSERGYSNMPVVENGEIIGVLTNKCVVNYIAKHSDDVSGAFCGAKVLDALGDGRGYFLIMPDSPIDDVLAAFERDRKLTMIIITDNGMPDGRIAGVITTGDLVTVSKMLDSY